MVTSAFLENLDSACRAKRSLLCVGLDPDPKRMAVKDIIAFNQAIIEATSDLVCAYKPNLAFFEALGRTGFQALEATLRAIPSDALTIGDGKRGDIGSTSAAYATALFDVWGFDSATVSPYLGHDSVEPFLAHADKGVFLLCRTSNPGGQDFQDLILSNGQPLFEHVAGLANEWNTSDNVGLVVGATRPEELGQVRGQCPEMPILIPGIGAQGGDLEASVRLGATAWGRRAIVNASRSVLYASSDPKDFADAARRSAIALRDGINQTLEAEGKGWS